MISNFLRNKITRNAGWLIGCKVIQQLINLVVGLLTARYLGPSNYGIINYAAAYVGFFSAICTLGINSVLVKEFSDCPNNEGEILGTSIVLRGISSIFSAVVIICISLVADSGDRTAIIVVALSTIGMFFHIFDIFNYWFQYQLKSKVTAVSTLIAYAITSLYRAILLILGANVTWFAFATAVDYIFLAIFLVIAYKKHNGGRLSFSINKGKQILQKSWHFILPGLMIAMYAQTDKIMLKQMISDAEIGYYSTAVSLCGVWSFVLAAIIDSMYPEIVKQYSLNYELYEKRNRQLYAIVFYISICVSFCFTIFADLIISILYGESYLPAAAPLRMITWYTAFSYLGVARNAWIVCENKQKSLIYIYASAAISNVVLNLIFIPIWGAVGAAAASLIAQITTAIIAPMFINGFRPNVILMLEAISLKDTFSKNKKI